MATYTYNPTTTTTFTIVGADGNALVGPLGAGDTLYAGTIPQKINGILDGSAYISPSIALTSASLGTTVGALYLLGGSSYTDNPAFPFGKISTSTAGPVTLSIDAGTTFTVGTLAGATLVTAVAAVDQSAFDNLAPALQPSNYSTIKGYIDEYGALAPTLQPQTSGTGSTVTLQGNAILNVGTIGADITLGFAAGGDRVNITGLSAVTQTIAFGVAGFAAGTDTIDLQGVGALASQVGDVVSTSAAQFTLSGLSDTMFTATNDGAGGILITAACYGVGTHLLTDRGEVAVETIAVGDRLVSALDGVARAVEWVGARPVAPGRADTPVRVRAGAFGPGLPARDLILSPDHALFMAGALIPVRHLIDGDAVARAPGATAAYWHVRLARHDVVFAEGLPAESLLDLGIAAASGTMVAHPSHVARVWDAEGCAPLVVDGAPLRAARDAMARYADIPPLTFAA